MSLHDKVPAEEAVERELAAALARAGETMPAEARERVRARLVSAIAPAPVRWSRRAVAPIAAALTAITLLGGVSAAVAMSRPGDLLFPLRESVVRAVRTLRHLPPQSVAAQHPIAGPTSGVNRRPAGDGHGRKASASSTSTSGSGVGGKSKAFLHASPKAGKSVGSSKPKRANGKVRIPAAKRSVHHRARSFKHQGMRKR
jgi:hypothetical protein